MLAGRREPEGKETVELIRATGGDSLFVKTDVSKATEVDALVQRRVEKFSRLDIAFNNAGIEDLGNPSSDSRKKTGIGPSVSISRARGYA